MNVKIDTKEKFTVITPLETSFAENMAAELSELLQSYLQKDIPHVVLNLSMVKNSCIEVNEVIANLQQEFYEKNCSFLICCLQEAVEKMLDEQELLEVLNVTPTESEAWDIVQMEEIEREILGDDFNN
jgi:anti-anti-sigma regulatory factor